MYRLRTNTQEMIVDFGVITDENESDTVPVERVFELMARIVKAVGNVRLGFQATQYLAALEVDAGDLTVSWRSLDSFRAFRSMVEKAWGAVLGRSSIMTHKLDGSAISRVSIKVDGDGAQQRVVVDRVEGERHITGGYGFGGYGAVPSGSTPVTSAESGTAQ
jgi:hypothetical protein